MSRRDWTERAIERVLRVPAGFMRDRTQTRIEELAEERGADNVDLALVEAGIEIGLQMMKEMVSTFGGASPEMASHDAKAAEAKAGETTVEEARKCPAHAEHGAEAAKGNGNGNGHRKQALNEVSVLSEMEKRRQELDA